jgi:hypothetical protein
MKHPIKKPMMMGLITKARNFNFKSKIKIVIVKFACYGLIPFAVADWLIQSGGLSHE